MSHRISLAARAFFYRRAAVAICLTFVLIVEGGCASARANRGTDTRQRPDVKVETTSEPAMAANVAIKPDEVQSGHDGDPDEPTGGLSTNTNGDSSFSRTGPRMNLPKLRLFDVPAVSDLIDTNEHESELLRDTDHSDSSMERLNAAMIDDSLRGPTLSEGSLTALDARVRADSLLFQAQQLLDIGQFQQALEAARTAQDLVQTAQLDYSPDEDRPIDLVRRIEGQLEAIRLTEAPQSESQIEAAPSDVLPPRTAPLTTIETASPQAAPKEGTGKSRIRRDWSNLFPRKKKMTPEEDSVGRTQKTEKPAKAKNVHKDDQQAMRNAKARTSEAVVTANRSVSLGALESVIVSSGASDSEVERTASEFETTPMFGSRVEDVAAENREPWETQDQPETRNELLTEPVKPSPELGDILVTPPEFDVIATTVVGDEIESHQDPQPRQKKLADPKETSRQFDSVLFYVAFGTCSLLAIACYRRGAT